MMLKDSPSFRASMTMSAAALAWSILSPRMEPERSITTVTSRLRVGRSVGSSGTPAMRSMYPPCSATLGGSG
jgi:hypothetical protein